MRSSGVAVKVDGLWLRQLGHVASATWGTRYGDGPCGPDLASVQVNLDPRNDTGFLRIGRTLEVYDRGVMCFGGRISGVGRGAPRTIDAKGWARVAWDATSDPTPGARIGRTADNRTYTPAAPTTHSWLLDASDLDLGVVDDRLYTRVIATYVVSAPADADPVTSMVTVDDAVAQGFYGVLPFALDLTPLGVISSGTATGYANAQLAEFAIPEWSSRIVTVSSRLLTPNGLSAHLSDVQAGQMVRMFHLPGTFGGYRKAAATDVILGEVEYSTERPDEITLAPQRVAVRSIADAVRAMAEARKALEQAA